MIIIAFFYLLRPGEYTSSPSDTQPFDYKSVQLFCGGRRFDLTTASHAEILTATFASLTFELQKNGVRGEVIGQGLSGHPDVCQVKALARRVIHVRQFYAPPTNPLAMAYVRDAWMPITPSQISKTIKQAVTFLGPELGLLPSEVSARCLRAAGANALLNAKVDPNIISLLGRWKSDTMFRYSSVQSSTLMSDYSQRMPRHGDYVLIPNQLVPMH